MKNNSSYLSVYSQQGGFTLIEIIITLVIVPILAAMLYSYFGTAITGSTAPITNLATALSLQTVMERVTADYITNYTSDLGTLSSRIGGTGAQTNTYYGAYTVVDNHFINWDAGHGESSAVSSKCLKVTLRDSLGENLTQIYTDKSLASANCQ